MAATIDRDGEGDDEVRQFLTGLALSLDQIWPPRPNSRGSGD
ncbi:protein of unknown function [Agrobacterium pusense]|uniref:Uncharacterized protein n=1 Tax=Agrobacterium pusense TaxID=648995 RepID=U4Q4S9_9HYPH|nr:protein of unknown function [Agrobacterium pusense]